MPTRAEIEAQGYTVNQYGTIEDPGKFEGEPLWVLYFYEVMLEGGGELWGEEGETRFDISPEDLKEFPELEGIATVILWESDSGFVNKATFAEGEEVPEPEYETDEALGVLLSRPVQP